MKNHSGRKQKTYIDVKFKAIFVASTFSMLIEYLMSLSDKIISGHIIGHEALSAITLVEPFTMIAAFAACVLSDITGAPVAEAMGKGDQKKAEQYLSQSLFLGSVIGLLLSIVYMVFTEQIINVAAGTNAQASYVRDYFCWLRFLPLPMILSAILYPVVLYRGGEMYCNISACVSVVSNVGLSIALCFQSGLRGIGAATVVGSCLGLIPLVLFFFSAKGEMHLRFHWSLRELKENLVYSVGGSLMYFYMAVFEIIMNLFLVRYFSDRALVIFTGIINMMGLITALSDGIVEFLIPMLGTYKGEQNELGRRSVMRKAVKASVIESIVVTVVVLSFGGMLASVFGVDDPELTGEFSTAVRIYVLSTCFYYVVDLYSKYYLYVGKPVLSFVIEFMNNIAFPVAFGLAGGMLFGLKGVWTGMSVAQVVLLIICFFTIRRNPEAGKDLLFLDTEKMKKQYMWNISMDKTQIMHLVEEICNILKEEGVSQRQINKAALAVEESQMHDFFLNENPEKEVIECSMLEQDDIVLILRNTGICTNMLDEKEAEADPLPAKLVSGMRDVSGSYILVNGNNRLIYHISKL